MKQTGETNYGFHRNFAGSQQIVMIVYSGGLKSALV
jgi:hypothetical protein